MPIWYCIAVIDYGLCGFALLGRKILFGLNCITGRIDINIECINTALFSRFFKIFTFYCPEDLRE